MVECELCGLRGPKGMLHVCAGIPVSHADVSSPEESRADRLWNALDRVRREGGYSPHHCPGCDAGTDETFYDEPADHHPDCWLAEVLASTRDRCGG